MSRGNCPRNYHLQVIPTADTAIRDAALTPLTETPHVSGHISGAGAVHLLKDTGQESLSSGALSPGKLRNSDRRTSSSTKTVWNFLQAHGFLQTNRDLHDALQSAAADLGLDFIQVAATPEVPHHVAKAPRIGVWVPWADTDSIGWIRYSLDQRKVPYTYLRDEDIRAGNLRSNIDVLLYGHVDLELAEQIEGLPKAWSPMPFKKTAQTPSFGTPAESDDITGGIGYEGLAQIQRFVDEGGLMVTLGSGSMLALEGGLVRFVRTSVGRRPAQRGRRWRSFVRRIACSRRRELPARTCASPSTARIIPSRTDIPRARGSSGRIFRSTTPATLAADGVLHDLPGWSGGSQRRCDGVGRRGGQAVRRERTGLGRRKSGGPSRDSRHAGGQGTRRVVSTSIPCTAT